jgi:hypothetical protein
MSVCGVGSLNSKPSKSHHLARMVDLAAGLHIAIATLAVLAMILVSTGSAFMVVAVINWLMLAMLLVHALLLTMASRRDGSVPGLHVAMGWVLAAVVLANAIMLHVVTGDRSSVQALSGFIAGSAVFSFFVMHPKMSVPNVTNLTQRVRAFPEAFVSAVRQRLARGSEPSTSQSAAALPTQPPCQCSTETTAAATGFDTLAAHSSA